MKENATSLKKGNLTHSRFDPVLNAVVCKYPNYTSDENFKEIFLNNLDLMKANKTNKILCDSTELGVMGLVKKKFIEEIWFPKAIEFQLSKLVFIEPKDVFGKQGVKVNEKLANEKAEDGKLLKVGPIEIYTCNTMEGAISWITK